MKKIIQILFSFAWLQIISPFALPVKDTNIQKLVKTIEEKIVNRKLNLTSFIIQEKIDIKEFEKALQKVFSKNNDITDLNLSNNQLSSLSGLQNLKNLESLDLSHNQITFIAGLSELNKLTNLDLSENMFEMKPDLPKHLKGNAEQILKNTPYMKKLMSYIYEILNIIDDEFDRAKEWLPEQKELTLKMEKDLDKDPTFTKIRQKIEKKESEDAIILDRKEQLTQHYALVTKLLILQTLERKIKTKKLYKKTIEEKLATLQTNQLWKHVLLQTQTNNPQLPNLSKQFERPMQILQRRIFLLESQLKTIRFKHERELLIASHKVIKTQENLAQLKAIYRKKMNYEPTTLNLKQKLTLFVHKKIHYKPSTNLRNPKMLFHNILQSKTFFSPEILSRALTKALEKAFHVYPSINTLILSNNFLETFQIPKNAKNIKHLDISENKLLTLTGLKSAPNLETLNVKYNKLKELKGLESLTKLKTLNAQFNKFEIYPNLPESLKEKAHEIFLGSPVFPTEEFEAEWESALILLE